MAIVVPLYEQESAGVYYNTAAVIDAGISEYLWRLGTYVGLTKL